MKIKLSRIIHNPFFVVIPVVVLLLIGWQHYTYASRQFNKPSAASNMLPNADFSTLNNGRLPTGWSLDGSSQAHTTISPQNGYVSGKTAAVQISNYTTGDVVLHTPKVAVEPGKTYLFKGYHTTTVGFTLLRKTFYQNGSSQVTAVNQYALMHGEWSTASDAFVAASNIRAVQYAYKVSGNGTLKVNGLYLEPQQDVYIEPTATSSTNLVANPSLVTETLQMPATWSTYTSNASGAHFAYLYDAITPYLQVQTDSKGPGEAKWQFKAISTTGQRAYKFSVRYRSDVPVPVIAEYDTAGAADTFETLTELPPASEWTDSTVRLETPPHAISFFVSLALKTKGTVDTQKYSVVDVSTAGAAAWREPLVSITFDDGWASDITNAVPILHTYSLPATYYINPSTIEVSNYMSAADLEMLKQNGSEIAAHGYYHDDLTAVNTDRLTYDLQQGHDYLQFAGYETSDFAAPYGRADPQVQWYARKYFTTLRSTDGSLNTRQSFNRYNLQVVYLDKHTPDSTIKNALQQAKEYHGWLIFVYHAVGGKPTQNDRDPSIPVETATFSRHIQMIHDSKLPVKTVADAYQEVSKQ